MLYNWFDHPLIEAWLERQLATSRLTTSHVDAASGLGCLLEMLDGNHRGRVRAESPKFSRLAVYSIERNGTLPR